MEPRLFGGELWLAGMPGTAKFRDLAENPRFTLHTATSDPQVTEGDAKIWGIVYDVRNPVAHRQYADVLFGETGLDVRGQQFEHLFKVQIAGAAAVQIVDGHLDVAVWRQGDTERVVRKH